MERKIKRLEQFQDYLARLFPVDMTDVDVHNRANGIKGLTRTVTFQVTDACNLACSYCYQINKSHHKMSFETAKKYTDMILQASKETCDYINPDISEGVIIEFIGGEPFLEIDLISQITDYFVSEMFRMQHPWATRYMISICSNGVLYFDPKVQAFLKRHMGHLSFSISIDGNKELHDSCRVFPDGRGSYDTAMAGVKHFTEVLHGRMGSKMTLAPGNIDKTFDAVISLIENNYRDINLNCVYEKGWNTHYARILYDQLIKLADYVLDNDLEYEVYLSIFEELFFKPKDKGDDENWCGGTGYMLSCDWKGKLYPCIRYMESSLGSDIEPIVIGDVDNGLKSTEEYAAAVNSLNAINRRTESNDICYDCPLAAGCSWCSALNYQSFGTVNKRVTHICIMHCARALANYYYWNKIHRKHNQTDRMKFYIPDEWALLIVSEDELKNLKELEGPTNA